MDLISLADKLRLYGTGRRRLEDELFATDKAPPRLGIYDEDEEDLCHEVITSACTIPGCTFTAFSLMDFENHYNASHRYTCSQCKRVMPSPHLLDLHIQETHDSFFAVMAAKKPSYSCYIQECTERFMNAEERLDHCIKAHKLPKDFRFEVRPKGNKPKKKNKTQKGSTSMEVDTTPGQEANKFLFHNSKQKGLPKYSGKIFTSEDVSKSAASTNIDEIMSELKDNLP